MSLVLSKSFRDSESSFLGRPNSTMNYKKKVNKIIMSFLTVALKIDKFAKNLHAGFFTGLIGDILVKMLSIVALRSGSLLNLFKFCEES